MSPSIRQQRMRCYSVPAASTEAIRSRRILLIPSTTVKKNQRRIRPLSNSSCRTIKKSVNKAHGAPLLTLLEGKGEMEIVQLPEIDDSARNPVLNQPKPPFISGQSGPRKESHLISSRKKELLLVKRENERLRKVAEARRVAELEQKEVKKAEIYAINAFFKSIFEQRFEEYSIRRKLQALSI